MTKYPIDKESIGNYQDRKLFEILKEDPVEVILLQTLLKTHHTIYNSLFYIYNSIKEQYDNPFEELFNIGNVDMMRNNIKKKMDKILSILNNKDMNNNIDIMLNNYLKIVDVPNNTIIDDYINMWMNRGDITKNYKLDLTSIEYFTSFINNHKKVTKPQRVNSAIILADHGKYYSFGDKNMDVLYGFFKYINEVKAQDLLPKITYYNHIQNCLDVIGKLSKIVGNDKEKFKKYMDNHRKNKLFII
jgi:hypothetical protein